MTLPDDNSEQLSDATALIRAVADLASSEVAGWQTYGPPEDRVQIAKVKFLGDEYTLLRGSGTYMAFTPDEWKAWVDGVHKGEFDRDAGIPASTEKERS